MDIDYCKKSFLCKVDIGVEGNVIFLSIYRRFFLNLLFISLLSLSIIIIVYGGYVVGYYGICVFKLVYGGICKLYLFYVVDVDGLIILGLLICTDLNLIIMNFSIIIREEVFKLSI